MIGVGLGALAGVVQLICFFLLTYLAMDAHMTALGAAVFAVPCISVSAACGACAALLFRRIRPRWLTEAVLGMIVYWGLCWLFSVGLAAVVRRSPGLINGSGVMALPPMLAALWIVGVVIMIPTAVLIGRTMRSGAPAA